MSDKKTVEFSPEEIKVLLESLWFASKNASDPSLAKQILALHTKIES